MQKPPKDVLRETDAEAIRLARTLLRTARFGAMGVLDPTSGAPYVSRVAVASDHDGAPIILVSALSGHTAGLVADPRCSLLLGEPGKGDPLAYPRISIACRAERIAFEDPRHVRIEGRFLSRNSKAKLYSGFADFSFFRLEPQSASLNGGFGKAYALIADDLLLQSPSLEAIAGAEQSAVEHMNSDHADAVNRLARHYGNQKEDLPWVMTGIDVEGFDLVAGERVLRIFFDEPLSQPADMHKVLVKMSVEARRALEMGSDAGTEKSVSSGD